MIFRLDPCGFFCIGLTYLAVGYADYVFINWLVLPTLKQSLWAVVNVVLFNVFLFLLLFAHVRAMLSDPGIVPRSKTRIDFSDIRNRERERPRNSDSDSDVSKSSYVGEDWTVCGRCESYRPPRAHHCRVCNRCVRKMDHHCPWINNCVGEYNQKYFLQFLIYTGIASAYCIVMVVVTWTLSCPECKTEEIKHTRVLHSIFVTIECVLFCLFVFAVSCDQFQSVFNDETAIEQVQRRGTYSPGKSNLNLLREVCGRGSPMFWLLPCHGSSSSRDYVHVPAHYPV